MTSLADALSNLPQAAMLAALAFFVHKILWLVRYRTLQGALVAEAIRALARGHEPVLTAWDDFVRARWADAGAEGPAAFVRRVDDELGELRRDLTTGRRSIEDLLARALASSGRDAPGRVVVLSLRRPGGAPSPSRIEAAIDLDLPAVVAPTPPDPSLYDLELRSRYGPLRRTLVFFSGAADVVFSAHHVAVMSQNARVPALTLVRRLSLALLILAVVLVDLVFGAKRRLAAGIDAWLHGPTPRAATGDFLADHLGAILAFGLWMAAYGALYLLVYALIRRRYRIHVRRLAELRAGEAAALAAIRRREVDELARWGREYGRSLDSAAQITRSHAETLLDHAASRLHRRVAPAALLAGAKAIADALFARLPEARGDLKDPPTSQRHSLLHHLWPREGEMDSQARFAQYRAAWQELERARGELGGERPSPERAQALWRSAILYATVFAPLVPEGAAESLRRAYATMVVDCAAQTARDLAELDRRLAELGRSLADQLEAARGLLGSKVELANQRVQAAAAALTTELIRVREQARLEAMAFEI